MAFKILVDLDGVVANFEAERTRRMLLLGLPVLAPEQLTTFYGTKSYEREYGPEVAEIADRIPSEPGFFFNLPAFPDAVTGIYELVEAGHDVRICTKPLSRNPHCAAEKALWILDRLGRDMLQRSYITAEKSLVDADYLIDDRPDLKAQISELEQRPSDVEARSF